MFIELLDGHDIQGCTSLRLHTMQLDPTMVREQITSHVFAALSVPITRTAHAEVSFVVADKEPRTIGLYTALEAVDAGFLKRNEIPESSLMMQTNGLNGLQYIGDDWTGMLDFFAPSVSRRRRSKIASSHLPS